MTQGGSSMPSSTDPQVQEGKYFALIGYISFLCLVPLIMKRDNSFALFHGKQGLVLFIFEAGVCILKIIPVLGEFIFPIAFVVLGVLSLVGILKVLMNEYWEMPVIHELAQKISL